MSAPQRNFREAKVLPDLASVFQGPGHQIDPVPHDLIGATVIRFGAPDPNDLEIEGGGLVIDYVPRGEQKPRRLVLEFTELGMWIAYNSESPSVEGG